VSVIYNVFAGKNVERIGALSDGLFAIAMTLLVLDLKVPSIAAVRSESDLWAALTAIAPQLLAFVMSFMTLGIFWIGQQAQLDMLVRSDRDLTWIHVAFLLAVSLVPFSTALLAAFITYRIAVVVYWFNIFLLGATLFIGWRRASRAGLVKDDVGPEVRRAFERRIIIAQALYAAGILLCVFSPALSIAAIVIVQLNYVFAPRLGTLYRL
jgi:uncharacterized membrane protein